MNFSRYKSTKLGLLILILLVVVFALLILKREKVLPLFLHSMGMHATSLPLPLYHSNTSIEEALKQRRSHRQFKNEALNLQQVAQLLWAAQGLTSPVGFRTAPSAGGLYPLELYLISGKVENLPAGIYHYSPQAQALDLLARGDKRQELATAAHTQHEILDAPLSLIITANYAKTNRQYGTRSERFVDMEVGHAAENVYLQTVSLGLGTVAIGVFDETALKRILGLPRGEEPLYIMPVGKPLGEEAKT